MHTPCFGSLLCHGVMVNDIRQQRTLARRQVIAFDIASELEVIKVNFNPKRVQAHI